MISPHPSFARTRFAIDGGDGDQQLLGSYMLLERVVAPWFDSNPSAWLMQVIGGKHNGLVFSLSPRTLGTIDEGVASEGCKSVIVKGLPEQPGCDATLYPQEAIGGMTFIDRV
ncbi:hypothetical protein [Sphingomonas sp. RB1R13]|uniref:hypothetical protein n=1 Tax=Sphingomonas sp. RB1R13 TaxID=3096159 RepID=UPI002FCABAEE